MRLGELANRYVQALCTVDREGLTLQELAQELATFTEAYQQSPELREVLENPGFSAAERSRVLDILLARMKLSKICRNFVNLLVDRRRTRLLPEIALRLEQRTDVDAGVVRAEVATATPMKKKQIDRLVQVLSRIRGAPVKVAARVDPALIGGATVRMEGRIYDGSVRRRLALIRQMFLEGSG